MNGIDFTGTPIDNITITESHEITEAVTDPDVGLAIETGDPHFLGWYDEPTPIRRRDGTPVLDASGRPLRGKGENPIGVSTLTSHEWIVLAIGFVVSFVVAYASVAWFMAWVRKRGFAPFAVYRIVVGIAVLAFAARLAG